MPELKYIRGFKRAKATTPGNAINIRERGINKSLIFDKLVRGHIIIKTDNDAVMIIIAMLINIQKIKEKVLILF